MGYFNGEWALILGGSSGMGLAAARRLASEGMHLVVVHRDRKQGTAALEATLEELRQQYGTQTQRFNVDALRPDKRKEVIARIVDPVKVDGGIKVLLHSLARGNLKLLAPYQSPGVKEGLLAELDAEYEKQQGRLNLSDFQATLEAMALSLYDWVRDLFDQGLFSEDARVLGLTSEGSQRPWPGYAAVGVAKAALEALCRSIALEFAPYGIRCNLLQPGVTDTPSLRMIPGGDVLLEQAKQHNPFHRNTTPEDVAAVVFLLCRKEAAWINGAIIPVDGGESMG